MIPRAFLLVAIATASACAQTPTGDQVLHQALQHSTLTGGGVPFHAVLDIAPQAADRRPSAGPAYVARMEVWWHDPATYRIDLTSPSFTLQRTVAGGNLSETHTGDFYPKWLETFALALAGPLPVEVFTTTPGGHFSSSTMPTETCVRRDDRINGITNDLTWGVLCLDPPAQRLRSILTFNRDIEFDDWQKLQHQQIPRTLRTDVLGYLPVVGKLSTLEPLSPADAASLLVTAPTPPDQRIATILVSTQKEESLVEHAPTIQWPSVHEGPSDGYMIVYARTDRTGQVRETAEHNGDNAELEEFGMQQALGYKFKPLLLNGVAVQMEMPLVLHFTSRIDNPTPVLTVEQMRQQVNQCNPTPVPAGILTQDEHAIIQIVVDETGEVSELATVSHVPWQRLTASTMSVRHCTFRPYVVDGKPVRYKGDFELPSQ